MSQGKPLLTDLMVKYPFVRHSREFFNTIPIEESFSSKEVLKQAEARLMNALNVRGRGKYERHLSELIEFSSFFVSAIVASQDAFLAAQFAKSEGEEAKSFFREERPSEKPSIIRECFGFGVRHEENAGSDYDYSVSFEEYLHVITRHELNKSVRWKLVGQAISKGKVYFTDNLLNDFFGDIAEKVTSEGVKNLRRAAFPRQLVPLREMILVFVPPQSVKPSRSYVYIDELMKHPISDGRHRMVWLVLAPFLVNVKKLDENEAVERIEAYVSVSGEMRGMKRFVEYNVKRAKRNGLMPPTLNKLREEHPELFSLLPKEVVVFSSSRRSELSI